MTPGMITEAENTTYNTQGHGSGYVGYGGQGHHDAYQGHVPTTDLFSSSSLRPSPRRIPLLRA